VIKIESQVPVRGMVSPVNSRSRVCMSIDRIRSPCTDDDVIIHYWHRVDS
jgi:hypothetical protein